MKNPPPWRGGLSPLVATTGITLLVFLAPLLAGRGPKSPRPAGPFPADLAAFGIRGLHDLFPGDPATFTDNLTDPKVRRIVQGRQVFETYCTGCHGTDADGNGPAAPMLIPRPRNFRYGVDPESPPIFKFRSTSSGEPPLRSDLVRTIGSGLPGSAMPNHRLVVPSDLDAVAEYILWVAKTSEFAQAVRTDYEDEEPDLSDEEERGDFYEEFVLEESDRIHQRYEHPNTLAVGSETPDDEASRERGRAIFQREGCVECHGKTGRGDGSSAEGLQDSWGFPIDPRDFSTGRFRAGSSDRDVYLRIRGGVSGTPMPSFEDLLVGGRRMNQERALVDYSLVRVHIKWAMIFLGYGLLAGFLFSLQFFNQYPFEGIEWLSPARVRMTHTNTIAFGFLVNGFTAGLYYAVPRLTGRPVFSRKLGLFMHHALQFTILSVIAGILLGKAQGVEWGETPTGFEPGSFRMNWIPTDALVAVCLLIQMAMPMIRARSKRMYVSAWYFTAGLIWTILTYAMGNVIPEWFLPGTAGAAVAGLYIHDLVGLFVTPMGWGLMYFFVPVILKKPIWSHALSIIGFWALAFFYPLNGVHHFLLSPIPMYVQYGAILATMAVEVVVTTVVVNFFATLWGRGRALRENIPIRWFYTGMVFYFITCLQCSWHTTVNAQKIIHFTDWVPGHA
ncbi:MAG: cbb3-type cytochrome c oxidase subunit I, partial [Planctomycetota bacterium]